MKMTEAFAEYGATLKNKQWACSAIADDGSVVVSLWQQFFRRSPTGGMRYEDSFWRWDVNKLGQNLMREQLRQALDNSLPIRVVIAIPETDEGKKEIEDGKPTNKLKKSFETKKSWTGRVVVLEDGRFVIDFDTATVSHK